MVIQRLLPWRALPMFSRSEEHTSELQSLMRISYAVFCLKKKNIINKKSSNKHNRSKKTGISYNENINIRAKHNVEHRTRHEPGRTTVANKHNTAIDLSNIAIRQQLNEKQYDQIRL